MLVILVIHFLVPHLNALSSRAVFGIESHVDRSITMDLESKMTCLYESLEKEMTLKLGLSPAELSQYPMAMRLTSPSGEFSDWAEGDGEASMDHNVTEDGDYEICISTSQPLRVTLNIFFHKPDQIEQAFLKYLEVNEIGENVQQCISKMIQHFYKIFYSIKYYNKVSVRDEAMQQSNSDYIQIYVVVFCITAVIVSIIEVVVVRRMFHLDTSRIRV
uniref:GOLD domain-containing protein n=1 Tax=Angiostrongylus cantonensis TaxID=6313 RepID=A0A0K0CWF8_ANGCA